MSKPKKIRETPEERAAKVQAQRTAARGERILSRVTPSLAAHAGRKFGSLAQARANADVSQVTKLNVAGDPSQGAGVSSITGTAIGGRKALSEGLSLAFQRATTAEDTLKGNVIASGTQTQALTNQGLQSLAGTAANSSLVKAGIAQDRRSALFNAGSSLAGGLAFRKLSKPRTPEVGEESADLALLRKTGGGS